MTVQRLSGVLPGKLLQDLVAQPLPLDPGDEPAADVAAARDRRQVVEVAQQALLRQPLQDAEVEGGAADAAAGEGQAGEAGAVRLVVDDLLGVLAPRRIGGRRELVSAPLAQGADRRQLLPESLLEGPGQLGGDRAHGGVLGRLQGALLRLHLCAEGNAGRDR